MDKIAQRLKKLESRAAAKGDRELAPKRFLSGQTRKPGTRPARKKNPLNGESMVVTGNIETDDATEAAIVLAELKKADEDAARARAAKKAQRFGIEDSIRKEITSGYYVCLVFVTADQAQEFVDKAGWRPHLDDSGSYVDGLAVAKQLGVVVTPESVPFRERRPDRRLVEEVGIIPDAPSRSKENA